MNSEKRSDRVNRAEKNSPSPPPQDQCSEEGLAEGKKGSPATQDSLLSAYIKIHKGTLTLANKR